MNQLSAVPEILIDDYPYIRISWTSVSKEADKSRRLITDLCDDVAER